MEELLVPTGKVLRYRCIVDGCRSKHPSHSIIGIFEHLATHYALSARRTGSPFNYRCLKCGQAFYLLGMAPSCPCTENNTRPKYVPIRADLDAHDVKEDVRFLCYVQRHAVPVLCEAKSTRSGGEIREFACRTWEGSLEVTGLVPPRSLSTYSDRTPHISFNDACEEEEEPGYERALRSRSSSPAVTPARSERAEVSFVDDLLILGNKTPTKRAPPADVSASGSSSLQAQKRHADEDGAPLRKSTVPTMQRQSRQDALLTPNPLPPRISRRMSRSPVPLLRPSSRSQSNSPVRSCVTTPTVCDIYVEGASRSHSPSTPYYSAQSTSPRDSVAASTWQPSPSASPTGPPMSPLPKWHSPFCTPCGQMAFSHSSWLSPSSTPEYPQNPSTFGSIQSPSRQGSGSQVHSAHDTSQQMPSVSQALSNPRSTAQASKPPERFGGSKFLEVLPPSRVKGRISSGRAGKASDKRKRICSSTDSN